MRRCVVLNAVLLPTMARSFLRSSLLDRARFAVYDKVSKRKKYFVSSSFHERDALENNINNNQPLSPQQDYQKYNGNVTILDRGEHHLVVAKPPAVLCHHSEWAGSRSKKREVPEIPMLQRVRQALLGERVNVIHRLDRGCSGCLLFAFAGSEQVLNATATLSDAMGLNSTTKTYIALVRGEGILHGRDFKKEGWFEVTRPIRNQRGILHNATTFFRFLAGQDGISNPDDGRPRASIVLARPKTGRWHQIRRHLNGLSHPILGDSSHGNSKVNREWKARGMPGERTCLHLAKLQMEPNAACPNGIDISCPLPQDMVEMLTNHLPNVWEEALPLLEEENIQLAPPSTATELPYEIYVRN